MSTTRKAVVLALLGFVVGAGLGVGYTAWSSRGFPIPGFGTLGPGQSKGLAVTCSGGAEPVILVTWTGELNPFIGGLQRSLNGGTWHMLGAPEVTSGQPHLLDEDVKPGTEYFYRIMNGLSQVSALVRITTDASSCSP